MTMEEKSGAERTNLSSWHFSADSWPSSSDESIIYGFAKPGKGMWLKG
jgi:hypothetical protein